MNTKNIIILVLFALVVLFSYNAFFKSDDSYKDDIEALKQTNLKLEKQRDSLTKTIDTLKTDFSELKSRDSILEFTISETRDSIRASKEIAKESKRELYLMRKRVRNTREKIDSLNNNPPNKSDSLLLESLKIKLSNVK